MNQPFVGQDQWVATAKKLLKIKNDIKKLSDQKDALETTLRILSNNRTTQVGCIEYRKIERPGAVDYKRIPELVGIDLDAYRKPNTCSWKISLKFDDDLF